MWQTWTLWLPEIHADQSQSIDHLLKYHAQQRENIVYGLTSGSQPRRVSLHLTVYNSIWWLGKGTQRIHRCWLCQYFGLVNRCEDLDGIDNPGLRTLLQLGVWYSQMFLFKIGIRVGTWYDNTLVVSTKGRGDLSRKYQRPKNITHCNCFFCCYPER